MPLKTGSLVGRRTANGLLSRQTAAEVRRFGPSIVMAADFNNSRKWRARITRSGLRMELKWSTPFTHPKTPLISFQSGKPGPNKARWRRSAIPAKLLRLGRGLLTGNDWPGYAISQTAPTQASAFMIWNPRSTTGLRISENGPYG